MKAIITGAAGFMGSWLADRIAHAGWDVLGIDDLSGGDKENTLRWAPPGRFVRVDIREAAIVRRIFEDFRPDVVWNFAAHPHEGLSQFSPHNVYTTTSVGSLVVFTEACRVGAKRIVHFSSMARYGEGDKNPPFAETLPCAPVDVYGAAKVASEVCLEALAETHGVEWVVIVPHNIYGPWQMRDDPARNVLAIWINQCLRGKDIFIYGDGEQRRAFSDIRDSVDCYVWAGTHLGLSREVINVGSGIDYSINEAANLVLSHFPERTRVHLPDRPREVKHAFCTVDKSTRLLGYADQIPLDLGIQNMVAWMRSVGPREPIYPVLELPEKAPQTWRERLI